ncbi:DUF4331 domain-containing protein [Blastococcus capsensis]|uniref:DUF4331 domain-containing protein n=1 Tax=Blastococcus capsensis TaxID=1564163 RepID=UPI0025409338|nr:DUF4331 domain-containing protein [Blastococcus capsensis]MDK3257955.1 DUF4331 domain-containing protein [Blastococcus capsensis]
MHNKSRSRRMGGSMAVAGATAVAVSSSLLVGPAVGSASSHREAPLILNDPLVDNTDVYAFVSPDKADTVTLIANFAPFSVPGQGPNYYPWATEDTARYNIKVDSNGDAQPDKTYRFTFTTQDLRPEVTYEEAADGTFLYNNGVVDSFDDENLLFKQFYTVTEVAADGTETVLVENSPVAPDFVGEASMPNYASLRESGISQLQNGGTAFAGRAEDPFFLDIRVFDLIYGADLSERGDDTLAGYNVNSIALQLPIDAVTADGEPVIGVWSTTERPSTRTMAADGTQAYDGDYVQVSRLGNPLVNEVVVPIGLKDPFNSLPPAQDSTVEMLVDRVLNPEVPQVVEKLYGIPAPEGPRDDLFTIFLTGIQGLNQPANVTPAEMLRLNTSIPPTAQPNPLGALGGDLAGFPNGRRLVDDVVDIELQALEGAVNVDGRGGSLTGVEIVEPLAKGDLVSSNDREFGESFPYLALPYSATDVAGSLGTNPTGGVAAGGGGTAVDTASASAQGAGALAGLAGGAALLAGGVLVLRRGRNGEVAQ